MGDVEYGKIYDFYLPPGFLRLYDGPAVNVEDMWRILGKGTSNGGLVVGTIIKPKLGLQPKPFGEACYAFWQGGDFIKNDARPRVKETLMLAWHSPFKGSQKWVVEEPPYSSG